MGGVGLINTGLRVAGDVGLINIGLVILYCLMLCWSSCSGGCGVNQHWSCDPVLPHVLLVFM